jgi:hypothetical protein
VPLLPVVRAIAAMGGRRAASGRRCCFHRYVEELPPAGTVAAIGVRSCYQHDNLAGDATSLGLAALLPTVAGLQHTYIFFPTSIFLDLHHLKISFATIALCVYTIHCGFGSYVLPPFTNIRCFRHS